VQWFIGAPALRHGGYLFWLLPAVLLAPLLAASMRDATRRTAVFLGAMALCVCTGAFAYRIDTPKLWGRPPYPRAGLVIPYAVGSTSIWLPPLGDQCWDAPLPCSPMRLTAGLRDPDDLGADYVPPPRARALA
jgi:hypothetical protein